MSEIVEMLEHVRLTILAQTGADPTICRMNPLDARADILEIDAWCTANSITLGLDPSIERNLIWLTRPYVYPDDGGA